MKSSLLDGLRLANDSPGCALWTARVLVDSRHEALVELGRALRTAGYRFVTPTPETHRRVNGRAEGREARDLRDVFGWNRPFHPSTLAAPLLELSRAAGIVAPHDASRYVSRVRYSTLTRGTTELLFVHSSFPTDDARSVFFGPDSYRFAALLDRAVRGARRGVDVGCGTGVGGLVLADRLSELVLADVNPAALELAAVNAALAGVDGSGVSFVVSDVLAAVEGDIDLVIANPPYLVDEPGRLYRDGGGAHGLELAARIVEESLRRLQRGGQLILYSGAPIEGGENLLVERLRPLVSTRDSVWTWCELEVDVFGEELDRPAYRDTERLAVVSLIVTVS